MPPGGHPARAEALATLGRIAHEKFVDDEIGSPARAAASARGVARVRLGRREPHPRHAPRLGEAAPRPDRAPRRADPRGGARQPGLDRGARDERLREVPPGARAEPRAEAALRRVLRVGRLAVHAAPRRLRAVHEDVRGRRGVRDDPPGARPSSCARHRASTRRSSSCRTRPTAQREFYERILATLGFEEGSYRLDPTVHPFCTSFSTRDVRMTTRYDETGLDVALVDDARGGPRPLRARDRAVARADAARGLAVARAQRVAEPHLGEPRRAQPAVLAPLVRAAAGDVPVAARRRRPRRRSSPRSTAPSPASSASRPTRRRTASTSSCASSSSSS